MGARQHRADVLEHEGRQAGIRRGYRDLRGVEAGTTVDIRQTAESAVPQILTTHKTVLTSDQWSAGQDCVGQLSVDSGGGLSCSLPSQGRARRLLRSTVCDAVPRYSHLSLYSSAQRWPNVLMRRQTIPTRSLRIFTIAPKPSLRR